MRIKPISTKQRQKKLDAAARASLDGAQFRARIEFELCVVCGKSDEEARLVTGFGHQAHHAIRQEVLKRHGLLELLWDRDNAVCLCEEPCHRRHTFRYRRVFLDELPARVFAFVKRNDLIGELYREYPHREPAGRA